MAKIDTVKAGLGRFQLRPGVKRILIVGVLLLIGVTIVFQSFSTYVRPYETAVKASRYGGGLDTQTYKGPGLFFTAPGVTFHRFPSVVQVLTISEDQTEASAEGTNARAIGQLEIDSQDGSKIRIDATILYRIVDAYKVMTRIGPGRMFENNALIPKGSQALKENLGKLKAEDFYDEVLRVKATQEAQRKLNEEVKELGLAIDHVLIRQYSYLPQYQQQIEERKVQDQLVFTNQSMAEAAKMEALRNKTNAEGEALVRVEQERGNAEVTKIRAEADLYSRKRRAEGELLVQLAEAEGTELENAAYRASAGSDNLVGLEMAEVLEGVDVIFLQTGKDGVNFLDLDRTLTMFDVK